MKTCTTGQRGKTPLVKIKEGHRRDYQTRRSETFDQRPTRKRCVLLYDINILFDSGRLVLKVFFLKTCISKVFF